ncbi:unnamed protein product, partial [Sphenostylis stenocarpa]
PMSCTVIISQQSALQFANPYMNMESTYKSTEPFISDKVAAAKGSSSSVESQTIKVLE